MPDVRLLQSLEDVPAQEWDSLVARCPDSTVFQTRAWLDAWREAFITPQNRPWILAAYEGAQLVGIAPLCLESQDGQPARLGWFGGGHSDYHTFPCVDAAPRIVEALLDGIASQLPAEVVIDLPEVPQFATLATCLSMRAHARRGSIVRLAPTMCPRLVLDVESIARINQKRSVRRSEQKFRELGAARYERLTRVEDVEPLLDSFFKQHVNRWATTSFPSLFLREQNRHFYRAALRTLAAADQLQFGVLWLGNRPVAQHFGMVSRGDLLWYKPTFDLEFARLSPGELLLRHLAVDASGQGLRALDFTRGDESFKKRFANGVTWNSSFTWLRAPARQRRARWSRGARRVVHGARALASREARIIRVAPPRALVLDVHSSAGLEVLQSLGRAGVRVDVASPAAHCLADHSRYVHRRFEQPPSDGTAFVEWLRQRDALDGPYTLIVPTTENSLLGIGVLADSDPLRRRAVLAGGASLETALSKEATLGLAERVGVRVPRSRLLTGLQGVGEAPEFPVVLKPIHSLVRADGGHRRLTAVVVRSAAERQAHLQRLLPLSAVQEQQYCGGFGLGVECLYDRGRLMWAFVHERVHELPLTGGGSSYRRSRALSAEALWAARRLLDTLEWHGVAMVEFKLDSAGGLCLMEINPRFWGSLALAIDCGVDFPCGVLCLASALPPGPQPDYRTRYFTRHLAMDVDWMKDNWRADHRDTLLLTRPRLRSLLEYLRPLLLRESHDHFSIRDPAVYLSQVAGIVRENLAGIYRRMVREPLFRWRARRQARRLATALRTRQAPVRSMLFLCYGNICRSPFADLYARTRVTNLDVDSAGFHPAANRTTPDNVMSAASALGVRMAERRSKVVDATMVAAADLVVVMDEDNLRRTLEQFPSAAAKVVLLGAIGGLPEVVIEDPYTMSEDQARAVLRRIQVAVDRLIDYCTPAG